MVGYRKYQLRINILFTSENKKGFLNPSEGIRYYFQTEITTITGLDFDGDKFFFLMIYTFIQKMDSCLK